jgi:Metallo-beta-lactamase superfamily
MSLAYDVFVNDPPPQDGFLPNGEPKRFSPTASTLIYGNEDAVLTDPGLTEDHARRLGDWVAAKNRNLTDIYITHGHGDHWFAAGLLAERFGARVVASAGVIAQMRGNVAARPLLWDKLYAGLIPPSPGQAPRRRRRPHDRADPAVPGRRRGPAENREHRGGLLQCQDRAVPGLPRADDPVGERQRALRRPRTPRDRQPPDHCRLLAVTVATIRASICPA